MYVPLTGVVEVHVSNGTGKGKRRIIVDQLAASVLDGLNETPEMPLHGAAGARVVLVCLHDDDENAFARREHHMRGGRAAPLDDGRM